MRIKLLLSVLAVLGITACDKEEKVQAPIQTEVAALTVH